MKSFKSIYNTIDYKLNKAVTYLISIILLAIFMIAAVCSFIMATFYFIVLTPFAWIYEEVYHEELNHKE